MRFSLLLFLAIVIVVTICSPAAAQAGGSAQPQPSSTALPQPSSTAQPQSSATADAGASGVKHYSAAEVTALFGKGGTLSEGDTYKIMTARRTGPGNVEIHNSYRDVFYIVDGNATIVVGGKVIGETFTNPDEPRGTSIEGGQTIQLEKGDVITIPAGVPHWTTTVSPLFLYFVVKVKEPAPGQPAASASPAAAQTPQGTPGTGHSSDELARATIAAVMKEHPTGADLGSWGYPKGLFLYGTYLVYKRTGEKKYLDYIQAWVDSHVDKDGNLDHKTESLDSMLAGNLLLVLYKETKDEKYKIAAKSIRDRFDTYPRTSDGGLWHATGTSRQWQLWLDGTFMSLPFLTRYGKLFNDPTTADEAAKNLLVYAKHLNDPTTGLMFHAYDESGAQPWADKTTHHSAEFWCRAIGWYGMALIEVLEELPKNHPQRKALIAQVQQLVKAYAKYQDPKTGLWYEVVDKADAPGNWQETSSSSMYTYTISRAVERGYVGKEYESIAKKGYQGVLSKITMLPDGTLTMPDICEGTNVGDLAFYLARARHVNDLHGLGSFLIMNEQMGKH